jgi:hypothetical protein
MTTDTDAEEVRPAPTKSRAAAPGSFIEKYKSMSDAALLRHFADGKNRKPN